MKQPKTTFLIFALIVLICSGWHASAFAYIDPPVLVPPVANVGQTIGVQLSAGICDIFASDPQDAYPQITVSGNQIHLVMFSFHYEDPIQCIFLPETTVQPLGTFDAGQYVVVIDRVYPEVGGGVTTERLAELQLVVGGGGAPPAQLPVTGPVALFALIVGVLLISMRRFHSRVRHLFAPMMLVVFTLFALGRPALASEEVPSKFVELLIESGIGAPSPDQIIAYVNLGAAGGNPPLESLAVGNPQSAAYLLPFRASGDFLSWIRSDPDMARSRLERYIVVQYDSAANMDDILTAFRADPFVLYAGEPLKFDDERIKLEGANVQASNEYRSSVSLPASPLVANQYGRVQLNIAAAWGFAGGYSLVGIVDTGLAVNHPSLRQFSTVGAYLGGNFIPAASKDISISDTDYDIDEAEPRTFPSYSNCYNGGAPTPPINAGHGTHVAGLIAANSDISGAVKGTCKHCGIAVAKWAWETCSSGGVPYLTMYNGKEAASITHLIDNGVAVLSMSLGEYTTSTNLCAAPPVSYGPYCVALTYAQATEAVVVASSGNSRIRINFPASDSRTIAVGGIDSTASLWDDSPGGTMTYCFYPDGRECGSNYTTYASGDPNEKKQEVVASSKDVWSTTYPGKNWIYSSSYPCGDGYPGPSWGNGEGLCTGTSMSAPQVAGVVGIMRSVLPLLKVSKPIPNFLEPDGIRTVLTQTTFEAQSSIPWSTTKGYGVPDAAAAVKRLLGVVKGIQVKNRVTPLFRFYSATNKDYADTTSPQTALALLRGKMDNGEDPAPPHVAYSSVGTLVSGYGNFPSDSSAGWYFNKPKANVYVLATEFKPRANFPDLIPIYLVDRVYPGGRDFMLVTSAYEIELARVAGYKLRTIQGYIGSDCPPESKDCYRMEPLYRECKNTDNDCAVFLESERITFESAGYTNAWPIGGTKIIGWAYGATDSDGDGLVDGFEIVAGTNPKSSDSDGDGSSDAGEYPLAERPYSDPCGVGNICP